MSDLPPLPPRIPGGPADDDDQWMARVTSLTDHDIDELIAGRTPEGMHDLAPVALVSSALRERTAFEIAPAMGPTLRHALADAPALTTRNHMGRIRRRLSGMAAVGVGVFAFAAATAANALPTPVQAVVAEAGELVGVDVPHPDDRGHDAGGGADTTSTADDHGTPDPSASPPATTPAGTTPADPGTPGDQEPATPATPATPAPPAADGHGLSPDGLAPGNDHPTGQPEEQPSPPTTTGTPNEASQGVRPER